MADPSVAPGPRAHAARVSAGICWQVVRPGAAGRAAQDVAAGTGGTFLCFPADSACSRSAAGLCLVHHRVLFKGCSYTVKKKIHAVEALSGLILD